MAATASVATVIATVAFVIFAAHVTGLEGMLEQLQALNARQMVCANAVGLLLAFMEWMLSSPPTNSGGGSGGTIRRKALMHQVGAGRVNLINYSTCLHRLARMVASPAHPSNQEDNNCNGGRQNGAEEAQVTVGPAICAAGVLAAEMAWGVDLDTSVLEGSNVLADWAIDIGGTMGGGSGNEAREAEDVLGTIAGGRGSGGAVASAWGAQ